MELTVSVKSFSQIRAICGHRVHTYEPRCSCRYWSLNVFNDDPHLIVHQLVLDIRIHKLVHRHGVPEKKLIYEHLVLYTRTRSVYRLSSANEANFLYLFVWGTRVCFFLYGITYLLCCILPGNGYNTKVESTDQRISRMPWTWSNTIFLPITPPSSRGAVLIVTNVL